MTAHRDCVRVVPADGGYIPTYKILSMANLSLARPDQALAYADKAMRLSPLDPYLYMFYALKAYGHIMLGERGRAIEYLRQAVANNPDFPTPIAFLAAMPFPRGRSLRRDVEAA